MDTDVIVVGAGPTGLMLAHELALSGTDVLVLDKEPGRSGESRALNLHPRTAEVLDLRGMLSAAEKRSTVRLESTHFARLPVPLALDGWNSRYPYQVGIPQAEVEQILESHVADLGVKVRWGSAVSDIEQDSDRVRAKVGDTWLTSRYLVGCDGGRSTVRKAIGEPFPGIDGQWFGTVADVVLSRVPEGVTKVWDTVGSPRKNPDGSFANIFPIRPEESVFRIFYSIAGQEIPDQRASVPDAEVLGVIGDFYGAEGAVSRVRWASRFSDASRQVERYQVDRVLLAGDSAHVHLPLGGQGLNLGLQDAMNLGWKLAAQVAGWAPGGLLDTYHDERYPVGAGVIANTRAQFALGQPGPEHQALREIFMEIMALPEANRHLAGEISGLSVRYDLGGDQSEVGARLPDFELPDGSWASTLFHSGHGVLLTTRPELLSEVSVWSDRVKAVEVPELPVFGSDAVLVRPDGHVCWATGTSLRDSLYRWFGSPDA